MNASSVAINPSQMATRVRVNGDVTNDDGSSVGIYETGAGSYLKADKIATSGDSSTYVVLHDDAAYTSLSGGTSEVTIDGNYSYLVFQEQDTASALANITATEGASASMSLAGNSTFKGNLYATGVIDKDAGVSDDMDKSVIALSMTGNSAFTGDSKAEAGGHVNATFGDASTMTGNATVSGKASDVTPSLYSVDRKSVV